MLKLAAPTLSVLKLVAPAFLANEPAAHGVQEDELPALKLPGAHGTHSAELGRALKVPAGQPLQLELAFRAYQPGRQGVQEEEELTALKLPEAHATHSLAPALALYWPAGQGEQRLDEFPALKRPGTQAMHSTAPELYRPAAQNKQDEALPAL